MLMRYLDAAKAKTFARRRKFLKWRLTREGLGSQKGKSPSIRRASADLELS